MQEEDLVILQAQLTDIKSLYGTLSDGQGRYRCLQG